MKEQKIQYQLISPYALEEEAKAGMDGANKYGSAFNWRDRPVSYNDQLRAIISHAIQLLKGEDLAEDSQVHHAGHIRYRCGIILDALNTRGLIDDRYN